MFTPLFQAGQYSFSVYTLIVLGTAIAAGLLGLRVVQQDQGSRISWRFLALTASMSGWLMGRAMCSASLDPGGAVIWARISYAAFPFLPVAFLQFTFSAIGREKTPRALLIASRTTGILLSTLSVTTPWVVAGVLDYPWGFYPRYGPGGIAVAAFFILQGIGNLHLLLSTIRRLRPSRRRSRLQWFATAYAVGCIGMADFIAAYGIPLLPLGHLAALALLFIVGTAIRKFQLFDLTPAFAAENILSTMQDGLIVADDEGQVRIVNDALCRLTGHTREELLNLNAGELITSARTGDAALRSRDGTPIPVSLSVSPLDDGEVRVGTVTVAHDMREQLALSERTWRETFDAIQMPMVIVDGDGLVRRANRAARERGRDELGVAAGEFGPGSLWREIEGLAREGVAGHVQYEEPETATTWDVVIDVATSTLPGRQFVVVARDVTALVALQQSLHRSERMSALGAIVGGVAHEVRNPLFVVSSTLDVFERVHGKRPELEQFIAVLREQVTRLSDLMSGLLDFGRPAPARLIRGDVPPVAEKAIELCEADARTAGVTISYRAAGDLPPVDMDERRLLQAFRNVVENAVQHSPAGRSVVVRLERSFPARGVHCSVTDEGAGFAPADVAHVFEPFFTRRKGGTGLGLSITRAIVEQHQGTVSAGNRPEGGAVISLSLPASMETITDATPRPDPPPQVRA